MSAFKVGDIVERVAGTWAGMVPGDRAEVIGISEQNGGLELRGFGEGMTHSRGMFNLHLAAEQKHPRVSIRFDPVKKPEHYNSDPSGVECITITRHRTFNIGNAIKYLWRAGLKVAGVAQTSKQKQIEDLRKAVYYIEDEIKLLENS